MILSEVKTKEGTEPITAYEWDEAPLYQISFGKLQRNKRLYLYAEEFGCLDTETSHIGLDKTWIYQWAIKFNGVYIYGRKPSEFIRFLERLRDFYKLHTMKKIIFYVHNLAYDSTYLKHYLKEYDSKLSIFAVDNHAVLIMDCFGFRFLCSYKLTNMSLDLLAKTYGERYEKAVGEVNYNLVRFQDEELTASDWFYMFSDVASQHDGISGYLSVNGYSYAYQAPYTSTGFVRAECRKAAAKETKWRSEFTKSALDAEMYALAKQSFMGGITIASWKYAGETIEGKPIGHKDFASSYPARQMMDYFPIGRPMRYGSIESEKELSFLLKKYCCIFVAKLDGVQIKEGITAPYIPSSKCLELKGDLKLNGKVIVAETLTMSMTEIDLEIIRKQYHIRGGLKVSHMVIFDRGPAPAWLKKEVMRFYEAKCTLKKSDPRLYMASKAKLNSIYGMSASSLVHPLIEADEELILHTTDALSPEEIQKQINRYYNSYNNFMPYQLGVYTTAHARAALINMIEAVGYENFLYCDTDSVFYIKTEEGEQRLNEMNQRIKERAISAGATIGDNILGLAESEPDLVSFRALHAKCYAMQEVGSDKISVTIAGIPKKSTKWIDGKPVTMTNADELGDINKLADGFTFRHCGGTRAVYLEQSIENIIIEGHPIETCGGCIIENIEKVVSDTMFTYGEDYSLLHVKIEQIYE